MARRDSFLKYIDDKELSKTRKRLNIKDHKKRHYGMDHNYRPGDVYGNTNGNTQGDSTFSGSGDSAGGISEMATSVREMHNAALPGAFSSNVMSTINNTSDNRQDDMKSENRRHAPRKRSFAEFLQWRNRAEEEESDYIDPDEWDAAFSDDEDEPENEFDYFSRNQRLRRDIDDFMSARDAEEDDFDFDPYVEEEPFYPENEEEDEDFDDYDIDGERELDFDDDEFEDDEFEDDEFEDDEFEDDEFEDDEFEDDEFEDDEFEDDEFEDDEFEDDEFEDDEFESDDLEDDLEEIAKRTGRFTDFYRASSKPAEEEQEVAGPGGFDTPRAATGSVNAPKIDRARMMFHQLINMPGNTRKDIIDAFIRDLDVTESTAVSYYERIAKEAGLTNKDDADIFGGQQGAARNTELPTQQKYQPEEIPEIPQEEINDQPKDRQGIIRHVDNAHLVYKRQMEDGGFEELWVYNTGDKLNDAIKIRRAILAGTDIPRGHTRSPDGSQAYTLTTLGNAQLLHITGLPN